MAERERARPGLPSRDLGIGCRVKLSLRKRLAGKASPRACSTGEAPTAPPPVTGDTARVSAAAGASAKTGQRKRMRRMAGLYCVSSGLSNNSRASCLATTNCRLSADQDSVESVRTPSRARPGAKTSQISCSPARSRSPPTPEVRRTSTHQATETAEMVAVDARGGSGDRGSDDNVDDRPEGEEGRASGPAMPSDAQRCARRSSRMGTK
mmetsp:Transcript_78235/g.196538  ORF Transcript_78235/g.196538 Transcript_78235/m.196538 type:complete len:209 (+) Transcript_78235:96-722(+)